jgi:hypothetical protein
MMSQYKYLLDGQVKEECGIIFGMGANSKGEVAYLVEMDSNDPAKEGHHIGRSQVDAGKCWILSTYEQELAPASA